MRRFRPGSLMSQMIVILLVGLVASHLIAGWVYSADRTRAARVIGGYAAAQRIANLARLIDEAPPEWRPRLIKGAADPRMRLSLSDRPPQPGGDAVDGGDLPLRDYLAEQLPDRLATGLQVVVVPHVQSATPPSASSSAWPPSQGEMGHMRMGGAMMHGAPTGTPWGTSPPGQWRRLIVSMPLTDGQFLTVTLGLPDLRPPLNWRFWLALGICATIVVVACVWAVRRVTAPLGLVTQAAERLGRSINAPPIAETGTREMRQAARAFNDMQARLQRLLHNRTTMLAALSHDLRTPLTLLRLRIESLPESEDRERMLANVATLGGMIDATLDYARGASVPEDWRRTDLAALLGSVVDDMADAGLPVAMSAAEPVVLDCQPNALRRAVTNLLDNAVKYGGGARLALDVAPDVVRVVIDDDGPGIPEAELQRVFEPFHRVEGSRSRETGGTGLGLAIAQAIAEAHLGGIALANRPEGGLRAILTLPRRG